MTDDQAFDETAPRSTGQAKGGPPAGPGSATSDAAEPAASLSPPTAPAAKPAESREAPETLDRAERFEPSPASQRAHHVVGIGASAGGLEALERVFAGMPLDSGMSFVIVQHLSPDFESHMKQLLGRITQLPIHAVTDGMEIEPNAVYLIPPRMEMVISNHRLLLTERSRERVFTHPIDQFFRALAHDAQQHAIGVVLSGTGSDGARGIADILESGGLVVAQDPQTCGFDSMPRNAQQTGHVHLTLAPEAIGEALARYVEEGSSPDQLKDRELVAYEEEGISRVFQLLQRAQGIDFANYKASTVGRRIQRQIDLLNLHGLDDYIERLNRDPGAVNQLYQDLLIGVTRFFRDTEAFRILEDAVIPELLQNADGQEVRVWICGCATGEEAYSLAILFAEAKERLNSAANIKLFATDAHKASLQAAACGLYPEAKLEDVSPARRERFFRQQRDGFHVTSELRGMLVFAPHNIINDPPFTQMHLVTCRNLLIYLQPNAQQKTLSLFHFALKQSGVLFLGPSESPGEIGDEFEAIDSRWKVFRKRRDIRLPMEMRLPLGHQLSQPANPLAPPSTRTQSQRQRSHDDDTLSAFYDVLISEVMPKSVLVDAQFGIMHTFGGAEQYFRFAGGRPTTNLVEVIHPELKTALAGALQHALQDNKTVRYGGLPNPADSAGGPLRIIVEPKHVAKLQATALLVKFEPVDQPVAPAESAPASDIVDRDADEIATARITGLENELGQTRQNLQATIEELETSNEELQATNEEMVASNEELQSTNEELHGVNEELFTVNAEHQARLEELRRANDDMDNLLASTRVGVIFLDRDLYIRRFTPEIARVFHLVEQDVGRSIESFTHNLLYDRLLDDLNEVLSSGREKELELRDRDGGIYLVRIQPYQRTHRGCRASGQETTGVVMAFIDVQSLKQAQQGVEQFRFMCDQASESQTLVDAHGQFVYVNEAFCRRLGYAREELLSLRLFDIDVQLDAGEFRRRFAQLFDHRIDPFETEHRCKDGSRYPAEVALSAVAFDDQQYLYATFRDISKRKAQDAQLRLLGKAIDSVVNGIVITDPNQPDNPITFANAGFLKMTGYSKDEVLGRNCRFLQGTDSDPVVVDQLSAGLQQGEPISLLIQNYRKQGEHFWNDLYITPVKSDSGEISHFVGVQNDVSQLVIARERARENETAMQLLLDSTAEGIFGIDPAGHCTFCNRSAARMLGYVSPDELAGKQMHRLIHHTTADGEPCAEDRCAIQQTLQTGERTNVSDEVFWRADGRSIPVEYWCRPIRQNDEILGAVITFVDISERLKTASQLEQARIQAEGANVAKSQFLANMSHELRTPLAAIMGFTGILLEESPSEPTQKTLQAIHRNGEHLLTLLNDVLDLSKIEAGAVQMHASSFDLMEHLRDLHGMMQVRAHDMKRTLTFHFPEPLPETVTTDPARLRQVLVNLIANGLKFSPDGKVDVTVCRVREPDVCEGDDADALRIAIEDNGIGIAADQLERLFQPFTQADDAIVRRFGGTGLGLSISRRLIQSLGGKIEVESERGKGSTFTICVPVGPIGELVTIPSFHGRQRGPDDDRLPQSPAPPQLQAHVLIADDMRDIRYIARHFLSKAGCTVDIAENGQEAIERIVRAESQSQPYDIVLMDMQMPIMGGEEAMQELRQRNFEQPIIALTADAMKGTRQRLLKAGFNAYLTKPVNAARLLETVEGLLDGRVD